MELDSAHSLEFGSSIVWIHQYLSCNALYNRLHYVIQAQAASSSSSFCGVCLPLVEFGSHVSFVSIHFRTRASAADYTNCEDDGFCDSVDRYFLIQFDIDGL